MVKYSQLFSSKQHLKVTVKASDKKRRPFNLNSFINFHFSQQLRSKNWFPEQSWLKINHFQPHSILDTPFENINLTLAAGTVFLPSALGDPIDHWGLVLNSPKPNDTSANLILGDTTFGDPMAPLDLIARMYEKGRVTGVSAGMTFQQDPISHGLAGNEMSFSSGVLRFGAVLSKDSDMRKAWATSEDFPTPPSDAIVKTRIAEAYRANKLRTVPLTVSNNPNDLGKKATVMLPHIEIMDQFLHDETTNTGPDPTDFSYILHNEQEGSTHASMSIPTTLLFWHPFCVIDTPLEGFGGTVEDTTISFHADTFVKQNHLYSQPRAKKAENEA